MMTYEKKQTSGQVAEHFVARIVLSSGQVAGVGYGPTEIAAARCACDDACKSDETRAAGQGHRRLLS
jgi:hypothetical protein